jgi:hypothetical protein
MFSPLHRALDRCDDGQMEFSDAAIDEFIAIYQRHYDEPISRDDALHMARQLVNLYRLFLRPLPRAPAGPEADPV